MRLTDQLAADPGQVIDMRSLTYAHRAPVNACLTCTELNGKFSFEQPWMQV